MNMILVVTKDVTSCDVLAQKENARLELQPEVYPRAPTMTSPMTGGPLPRVSAPDIF
jgi:hypothetical protein